MYSHTTPCQTSAQHEVSDSLRFGLRKCLCTLLLCCLFSLWGTLSVLAAEPESQSPEAAVSTHGSLHVSDGVLLDEHDTVFQLQGVSTHNLAWYPELVNKEFLSRLQREFQINAVRLSVYPTEAGGYCSTDPEAAQRLFETVCSGIEAASELGLYVIVDWHLLPDTAISACRQEALSFFERIASAYRSHSNILYEICNEPGDNVSWEELRTYAADLIDCIRYYSPNSVVIVGTPSRCQNLSAPLQNPISRDNLLYSLHVYSASADEELFQQADQALQNGLALIVSQFCASDGSGTASADTQAADRWISMLDYYNTGYLYWSASGHEDSNSIFTADPSAVSEWMSQDYTTAGQWFRQLQNTARPTSYQPDVSRFGNVLASAPSDDHWVFPNGCEASVTASASWSADSLQYTSYDITLTNTNPFDISSWRLLLTWSDNISLKEYWSCDVGGSDYYRFLVPAQYNAVIPAGASVSFGLVAYGSSAPLLTSVSYE